MVWDLTEHLVGKMMIYFTHPFENCFNIPLVLFTPTLSLPCPPSFLTTHILFHSLIQFSLQIPHCCFIMQKNVILSQIFYQTVTFQSAPLHPTHTHYEVFSKKVSPGY